MHESETEREVAQSRPTLSDPVDCSLPGRRMQAKTISRIRFLQKVLEHSRVIDPDALPKDRVCLLSHVEFTNLSTNTRMKFEIVSPHEMNLEAGKISLKSPIGAALMGKKVGEIAEAQTPSGILRLKIESITLG